MNNLITQIGGPTILVFIGGIIAAIGAVWSAYEQNTMSDRLNQKNEEIILLNKSINDAIIGGDSFCYLMPTAGQTPIPMLVHSGSNPVYDLNMRIVDLDVFDRVKDGTLQEIASADRSLSLGNIPPQSSRVLAAVLTLDTEFKRFNIFYSARNGFFTQELRMRRTPDGVWRTATRVTRNLADGSSRPVFTDVRPDYPTSPDGRVDWN